jgi:hypothetical protein
MEMYRKSREVCTGAGIVLASVRVKFRFSPYRDDTEDHGLVLLSQPGWQCRHVKHSVCRVSIWLGKTLQGPTRTVAQPDTPFVDLTPDRNKQNRGRHQKTSCRLF